MISRGEAARLLADVLAEREELLRRRRLTAERARARAASVGKPAGRPRSADSLLTFAERWGVSVKVARRLRALKLDDEHMAIMVGDSKHILAARRKLVKPWRDLGGMRARGMRSRIPAIVKLVAK